MILSENRFLSPIGVEDMLFGIMHVRLAGIVARRRGYTSRAERKAALRLHEPGISRSYRAD
jgi:hypothetical protein